MSEEPLPAFDAVKIAALIRRGDEAAIAQAYAHVFAGDLGRLVLAHHLTECGVGNLLKRGEDLEYRAGLHDGALQLAAMAAVDNVSVALAVLTDTLEERTHANSEPEPAGYVLPDDEDVDL